MDSFFNRGFKAAKCKTLLKLTIPRIKLLRNRRELQIKQMRRDIAKLLETGQEATARIRVEHIVREENMMAAQEIIELFCELIVVRLPIIEAQRECPLDLKEAICSICFAAPRCADLPELIQVQMMFAAKYGKEFVAAATELMPDCGVNRQLVELLSVRAPAPEKKLKLLKEIAEEHELEWDPAPSETELFKTHEDLLNGPKEFVSGSKLPLPKEKHDEVMQSASVQDAEEHSDSEPGFDSLEFPEVPKVSLKPVGDATSAATDVVPPPRSASHPENLERQPSEETEDTLQAINLGSPRSVETGEIKQYVPFISPPSVSSVSLPATQASPSPTVSLPATQASPSPAVSRAKSDTNVDLQDVLAAANAAAESAERAAAAARSAASLAEARISKLGKSRNDRQSMDAGPENPFYDSNFNLSAATENLHLDRKSSVGDFDSPKLHGQVEQELGAPAARQPQRIPSMDDDPYSSYPNLFMSHNVNPGSNGHSA